MRLPFLKTKDPAPSRPHVGAAAAGSGDALVDAARTRARQRLAGALVLLATGVIGFPLLFETQPRPLAVDTPIEVLRQDGNRVTTPAAAKAPSPSLPPADAGIEVASEAAGPATMPASALADSAVAAVVLGGRQRARQHRPLPLRHRSRHRHPHAPSRDRRPSTMPRQPGRPSMG